jgi:hypothetical protein
LDSAIAIGVDRTTVVYSFLNVEAVVVKITSPKGGFCVIWYRIDHYVRGRLNIQKPMSWMMFRPLKTCLDDWNTRIEILFSTAFIPEQSDFYHEVA